MGSVELGLIKTNGVDTVGKIKLLVIGGEGGGYDIYALGSGARTRYITGYDPESKYLTLTDLLIEFKKNHDPILWYYPAEVHPDAAEEILPLLLDEYQTHSEDHFMNLRAWEEKLNLHFEQLSNRGHQTFRITPVLKTETYNYNHYGDERVLESITTDYSDKPKLKQIITGTGIVEENTFVIRDRNSVLSGVFPLERYEVEILVN
jgi:hypothetical protein